LSQLAPVVSPDPESIPSVRAFFLLLRFALLPPASLRFVFAEPMMAVAEVFA